MLFHSLQIISIIILIILFTFSYIGFGVFLNNILFRNLKIFNLGQLGLLGIFFLIFLSYLTSLFVPHNSFHNIAILIIGIFFFAINKSKIKKSEIKILLYIIFLTLIFFFLAKNHDDFQYYHLPLSLSLSEKKVSFGMGLLNYGYRHHSSLLFLNSLTFLPIIKFYLFNLPNYLILTFVNSILISEIIKSIKKKDIIFLISIFFLVLINVKFTRLSEYGTDLAGQLILSIIFINFIKTITDIESIEKIYFNIFLLLIIFSFKIYFLIYFVIIPIIFLNLKINPFLKENLNLRILIFVSFFMLLFFLHNFISTGCLAYPIDFTCVGDRFFWSLSHEEIKRMNLWGEVWAKAGATPNYVIDDFKEYVSGINWVPLWFEQYFLGKFTDFLFVLLVINLTVFLIYNKKIYFDKKNFYKIQRILLLISVLTLIFWFFKHPSLRYGGYFPLSLFIFSIFLFFYSKLTKVDNGLKSTKVLILIVIFIFNFKNITRLINGPYKFDNPPFFNIEKKDFKAISLDGYEYMFVTDGYCWATPTPCSNTIREIKIIHNYTFFVR
ncbi:hypothetical protein N8975_02025 [Candidatus Pelagibacter ubique]|nr:hypothetical protein [Candidatus Pelagibacter ubique]